MTPGKKAQIIFNALTVDERRTIANVKLATVKAFINKLWPHIVGNEPKAVAFAVALKCGNKDLLND